MRQSVGRIGSTKKRLYDQKKKARRGGEESTGYESLQSSRREEGKTTEGRESSIRRRKTRGAQKYWKIFKKAKVAADGCEPQCRAKSRTGSEKEDGKKTAGPAAGAGESSGNTVLVPGKRREHYRGEKNICRSRKKRKSKLRERTEKDRMADGKGGEYLIRKGTCREAHANKSCGQYVEESRRKSIWAKKKRHLSSEGGGRRIASAQGGT